MTQIIFDASYFARVAELHGRLPADMQKIAFRRAAARARRVVDRDYARFASRVLKVAQKRVKARMIREMTARLESCWPEAQDALR